MIPLWVRTIFKFTEEGTISILHVKPLESLEEKIVSQGKSTFYITCADCGADADIVFNEYESLSEELSQRQAMEGL